MFFTEKINLRFSFAFPVFFRSQLSILCIDFRNLVIQYHVVVTILFISAKRNMLCSVFSATYSSKQIEAIMDTVPF